MPDFFILTGIIAVCSLVQSLFGVGLLVFGTPALILLGYPFQTVLGYLLPCSITVSLLQALEGKKELKELNRQLTLYCIPFIVLGLTFVVVAGHAYNTRFYVGCLLLANAAIRLSQKVRTYLSFFLKRQTKAYLVLMGLVHGLTNMGGGLLTVLVNALFERKEAIRANIAGVYLIMALVQIIFLSIFGRVEWDLVMLLFPALSAAVFLLFGNRLFRASTQTAYQHLMTVLIFLFGLGLVAL